jgi:hypothetical protein
VKALLDRSKYNSDVMLPIALGILWRGHRVHIIGVRGKKGCWSVVISEGDLLCAFIKDAKLLN